MLKKLEKIEQKLNETIEKVLAFLISLIPQFVFDKIAKIKQSSKSKFNFFFQKLKSLFAIVSTFVSKQRERVNRIVNFISNYPLKDQILKLVDCIKVLLLKTPLKSHAHNISSWVKSSINSIDSKMEKIGKGQLTVAVFAISLISFGLLGVINSTNKIIDLEYPNRAPASAQEYKYKPAYKMFSAKTIRVLNVQIPVYREKVTQIRSVTVDFTVRTSTRFAKKYLTHYENQLKDYLFTRTEPVLSSFAIEEEGKQVIKEKIAYELNNFLKENNVEGEVEEVAISFIVAN